MAPTTCPSAECGADLRGPEIPQEYRDAGYYGDKTHYLRVIGHEVPEVYDGTLFWSCPDCGHTWHRFGPGDRLYAKAVPYVGGA